MLTKSFNFLSTLKENNYKEWFHENKPQYEEAKKEFETFVGALIHELTPLDKEIAYLEPKDCTFRIFRDVRFSNDKTPYKTNFGAFLAKGGGRKSEYGGYYFHLEPGRCMLGGGIWMPQPDVLKAVRQEIYDNVDEFLQILAEPRFVKHIGELDREYMLKTAPRDFPKDWPHIGLLKYKCYTVSKSLPDAMLSSPELLKETRAVYESVVPVMKFFNRAVEELRVG
jgi:uncharacterized protein (TIGR02453 family)